MPRPSVSLAVAALAALAILATGVSSYSYTPHQKKHIRFHLFTESTAHLVQGPPIYPEFKRYDLLSLGFNKNLSTSLLIHGFSNNLKSDSMQLLKNAFLAVEKRNVIVVDWGDLDPPPLYNEGTGNMRGVAARTAELVDFLVEEGLLTLDKLHVIGHSLGAHIAGIISEYVSSGRLARVTGLDPAMPLIDMTSMKGHLSPNVAKLVEVVHTNAGFLGTPLMLGHVDFYPNGGRKQPGCGFDFTGACSHGRSYQFWAESITDPTAFRAWHCKTEKDALRKKCRDTTVMAYVGQPSTYSQQGAYFFETRSSSPFKRNR